MRRFINIDSSNDITKNIRIMDFLNQRNAKSIAKHWYSMDCDEHVNDFIQSIFSITSDEDFVLLIEEPTVGDYDVRQIRGSLIVKS